MSAAIVGLDSVRVTTTIPVEVSLRLKKRADERGETLAHYIAIVLYAHTQRDPWTIEDEHERHKIVQNNIRKREEARAIRKGK